MNGWLILVITLVIIDAGLLTLMWYGTKHWNWNAGHYEDRQRP